MNLEIALKSLDNLTGQRFGTVTALQMVGVSNKSSVWLCLCDCGLRIRKVRKNLAQSKSKGHIVRCSTKCPLKPKPKFVCG